MRGTRECVRVAPQSDVAARVSVRCPSTDRLACIGLLHSTYCMHISSPSAMSRAAVMISWWPTCTTRTFGEHEWLK